MVKIDESFIGEYAGSRNGYNLYMRMENGKGVWTAIKTEMGEEVGEPIQISYEQARGFEPIDSDEELAMKVGRVIGMKNIGRQIESKKNKNSMTEARSSKPKFWYTQFARIVIKDYKSGKLTFNNIDEWDAAHNGGIKPIPPFNTGEIIRYYLNNSKAQKEMDHWIWQWNFINWLRGLFRNRDNNDMWNKVWSYIRSIDNNITEIENVPDSIIEDVIKKFNVKIEEYKKVTESSRMDNEFYGGGSIYVGLYGDDCGTYGSLEEFKSALKKAGIKILDVSGDEEYGWDMTIKGIAKEIYKLVDGKIPGYNCNDVMEFIEQYSLDPDEFADHDDDVYSAERISNDIPDEAFESVEPQDFYDDFFLWYDKLDSETKDEIRAYMHDTEGFPEDVDEDTIYSLNISQLQKIYKAYGDVEIGEYDIVNEKEEILNEEDPEFKYPTTFEEFENLPDGTIIVLPDYPDKWARKWEWVADHFMWETVGTDRDGVGSALTAEEMWDDGSGFTGEDRITIKPPRKKKVSEGPQFGDKWGILVKNRGMWGGSSWCKRNGEVELYDTEEEAQRKADEYNSDSPPINNFSEYFAVKYESCKKAEDTVKKSNGKWTNKGNDGEHGEFITKKAADAQRKAMFANGYKGESVSKKTESFYDAPRYFLEFYDDLDDKWKRAVNNLANEWFGGNCDDEEYGTLIDVISTLQQREEAGYDLLEPVKLYDPGIDKEETYEIPMNLFESWGDSLRDSPNPYDEDEGSDFDDGQVVEGDKFTVDGIEYMWLCPESDKCYLDFDTWQIWSASDEDNNIFYFIVESDTAFVDWGPCETIEEAEEFLQSKVDDYNNDEDDLMDGLLDESTMAQEYAECQKVVDEFEGTTLLQYARDLVDEYDPDKDSLDEMLRDYASSLYDEDEYELGQADEVYDNLKRVVNALIHMGAMRVC